MEFGSLDPLVASVRALMARGVSRRTGRKGERGQGLVEYGFIIILVAIVVIVILSVVGSQTKNVFSNVSNGVAQ